MIELINDKYHIDSSLTHYRTFEHLIGRVMIDAVGNNQSDHDKFSPLENDPERFVFQRADCIAVSGTAGNVDDMRGLAPLLFEDFDNVLDELVDTRSDMLSAAAGAIEAGKDIVTVCDHRDVIAVAVNTCIFTAALHLSNNLEPNTFNTEIVVSEMLKNTSVIGIPAVELMSNFFSVVRFVVPSNNQGNKLKLPNGYADDANRATTKARRLYTGKPKITALAPSATSDIKIKGMRTPRNPHGVRYIMGPPTDGTINEYMIDNFVLATGGDLSMGKKGIFIGKLFRDTRIKNISAGKAVMQYIADGMTEQTGIASVLEPDVDKFQKLKLAKAKK